MTEFDELLSPKEALAFLKDVRQVEINRYKLKQWRIQGRIKSVVDPAKAHTALYRREDLLAVDVENHLHDRPFARRKKENEEI